MSRLKPSELKPSEKDEKEKSSDERLAMVPNKAVFRAAGIIIEDQIEEGGLTEPILQFWQVPNDKPSRKNGVL
jgi:hypothetical protein